MQRTLFSLIFVLFLAPFAMSIDVTDTRLLSDPAVSGNHIAFVYDYDLWVAGIDGSGARRLTSHPGQEFAPAFSPNGNLIAFSAEYDGNVDVFVVETAGGSPRRLTWHPGPDIVLGFSPDGGGVLFRSGRSVFTNRYTRLFNVAVDGGFPTELPIPNAYKASYSPDGTRLAYTPLSERFRQWKNYRGGTVSRIWVYNIADHSVIEVPQAAGRSNDTDPMWVGDKVYFISDRAGEFNLFSFDPDSKKIAQLTRHQDFPIIKAAQGAGKIILEQGGYLHLFDPGNGRSRRLSVAVASDTVETRPRWVGNREGRNYIRSGDISPSGARAVFEFRGEIVTVPASKGDPRNLTGTAGIHERSPTWSPDGARIAYFSDESGNYQLVVRELASGESRSYDPGGAGFYASPKWSPDSTRLAFTDNSMALFWIDLESGRVTRVSEDHFYGPSGWRNIAFNWSPDSDWLAFTRNAESNVRTIVVYSTETGESNAVTDGLSDVSEPVFDTGGDFLYFFASTDAGPVRNWFAMSNADMLQTNGIYLAVLRQGVPSPIVRESDEEGGKAEESEESDEESEGESDNSVQIDFAGIDQRILALPVPPANYSNLQVGSTGEIYYLESPRTANAGSPETSLKRFTLKGREAETMLSPVNGFTVAPNGKKLLYNAGNNFGIVPAQGKLQPGQGKLGTDRVRVRIEPRAEWRQILHEAWRINRDEFYDPNFHGADWEAMWSKYEIFLPHLANRSDLNRVIQWMCSELAVGHHGVGGGDFLYRPDRVNVGLLGADYDIDQNHYRFSKVFGGLNWNPSMRAPLTEPGVDVSVGEYLLAVAGQPLDASSNLFSLFEGSANQLLEITVGPNADGADSRTVSVVPISNESALRNRDWVEGNVRKVHEATDGRVAYVYVPNTSSSGHTYFKRYFFPQTDKQAVIVDERFNGGGLVADYYIDHLRRPFVSYWATRYGQDLGTPAGAVHGPKVMLIDETAGSGGDLLPWMFRKFNLGPLIGKRTWGGLVGTLGFPILMDGGSVTAPNLAIWTEEGFVVENEGVPPDIEVEQWPAEVIAGRDPQLEKAIEVILDELRKNPPVEPKKPAYPTRAVRP